MPRHFFSLLLLLLLAFPAHAQSPAQEVAQGNAAWERDDYKAAEIHFDRALKASNGNANIEAPAFHGRGVARLEQLRWPEAKADLDRAVQLDPTNANAFAARGMARKGIGDYNGLLVDAREAARLDPTNFASFEDDAKSTVLYRRMMIVFLVLAGILLCIGGYSFARVIARITSAERDAKRASG